MSLREGALSGVKWTSMSSVIISLTQVLQLIILTKLLDPSDFGLMAIVLFVINFSQIFIDLGISNAIIFNQKIEDKQLSTLYILNLIIGAILFITVFYSSSFIADFYNDFRLTRLIEYLSVVFLIVPFGQQYQVLLKKELHFKSLATRDVISRVASFIFTIALAYLDYGVLSLVYGNILYNVISTLLLIFVGYKFHKPQLYFNLSEVRFLFSFGFYQMGEKLVNYLNKEVDTLVIGKLLGMEALGIYNIAKDFISKPYQLINPILTKVSFPVFAKIQNDLLKVKNIYIRTIDLLSFINSLIFIFCFFFSREIILLFFGEKWLQASVVMSILSLYMLLRSIGNPIGSLQLGLGRADLGFFWNLAILMIVPIFVYLGSFWGLVGVTLSLLLSQILLYFPSWKYMVYKLIPLNFKEYYSTQYPYFIFAIISCLTSYIIFYKIDSVIIKFVAAGLSSTALYFSLFFFFKRTQYLYLKSLIKK